MAITQPIKRKKNKYEELDKSLFGGLLPGGERLGGEKAPAPQPIPETVAPQVDQETATITPDTREGATYQGGTLTKEEYEQFKNATLGVNTGLQQSQNPYVQSAIMQQGAQQQQLRSQQLASQIGQYGQLGTEANALGGVNFAEAGIAGLTSAIPRALSLAATGAAAGALGGTAALPGIGTGVGAAIGAIGGFVSGISSGIIGNMKQQRRDTVTAQKRTLDEGKQNLNDWATLAAADPANRQLYLAQFNKQLALIDQAYTQMKIDTQTDLLKFETALPDLAEFEAFYSQAGERDFAINKMVTSLGVQAPEYEMLTLANKYG